MIIDERNVLLNSVLVFSASFIAVSLLAIVVFVTRACISGSAPNAPTPDKDDYPKGQAGLNASQKSYSESQNYAYSWFGIGQPDVHAERFQVLTNSLDTTKKFKLKEWPSALLREERKMPPRAKRAPFRFLNVVESSTSPLLAQRKKYLVEKLLELRPPPEIQMPASLRILELLHYKNPLPPLRWASPLDAEHVGDQISGFLVEGCPTAQTLGLVRLMSWGQTTRVYANPVHFTEPYCKILVLACGDLDRLARQSQTLQEGLTNCVACFCWEHWHLVDALRTISENNPTSPIYAALNDTNREYFAKRNSDPFNVSRPVVFDLSVGVTHCALVHFPKANSARRAAALLQECAANTKCGEFRQFLPTIGQAVASSLRPSKKAFFYDVLLNLVRPHVNCCLSAKDVYSLESILQSLIRHALTPDQHMLVRERSGRICHVLGQRFTEVSMWTTAEQPEKIPNKISPLIPPGAWLVFR